MIGTIEGVYLRHCCAGVGQRSCRLRQMHQQIGVFLNAVLTIESRWRRTHTSMAAVLTHTSVSLVIGCNVRTNALLQHVCGPCFL
jgi:hypothetical protein